MAVHGSCHKSPPTVRVRTQAGGAWPDASAGRNQLQDAEAEGFRVARLEEVVAAIARHA